MVFPLKIDKIIDSILVTTDTSCLLHKPVVTRDNPCTTRGNHRGTRDNPWQPVATRVNPW